ncbi:aa3-type cytochrome c oxidase subunit IV [Sphingomonas sp. G-3-2-10]|jgi:hypothetical protein|nr:aa3-type cytochrome c oxidase subunit IV [Sphingomonas sp. G-3-2-10]NML07898.1 aa3-type cytochrome c oxidase subunit IV [Sphingomonas sp. G-3-2-10]
MADDNNATHEIKQHAQTFAGFVSMMTWGTVACFAVGALVVFLIAK